MSRLKTFFATVGLVCLGIIFALILMEVGLRLVPRARLNAMVERTSQRLHLYRLDSRIGWTLRPNARSVITTKDGLAIPMEINSLGLHDDEHTYKKPAGIYRALILGDSFAEAQEVYLQETFHYRVEQCLTQQLERQTEVINGGVSGYNTADEYLFYKYEGAKYNPELVLLVVYVGNDLAGLNRTINERMVAGFGGYRFSLNEGNLHQTWVGWESPEDGKTSTIELMLRRHSLLYRTLAHPESKIFWQYKNKLAALQVWFQPEQEAQVETTLRLNDYIHVQNFPENPVTPQKMREMWSVFRIVTGQLKAEVEAGGSQLVVVVIPANYQANKEAREKVLREYPPFYDPKLRSQWSIDEPNVTIAREMEQQLIPVLDLLPYFQRHDEAGGSSLYFDGFTDEHLNRDGHKLMADVMCDWLIRNEAIRLPRP